MRIPRRAPGLEPQQYLMLLVIRGLPQGGEATIRTLADRVVLKHQSTVGVAAASGLRVLEGVARHRISELRSNGRQLVDAIKQQLEHTQQAGNDNRERKSPARRGRDRNG